ncbi:MAG: PSD1 and planctomycete cytochrome C domain-containing protein [Planctomycetota bacterium]
MKKLWIAILLVAAATGPDLSGADPVEEVSFATDVLPILSDKCFVCHGPDTRDPDLVRLDSFAAASVDLGGYRAIDSASPEDSELLARIESTDDPMPPVDAEKQLTDADRQLLRKWIETGGKYETHWAYVVPTKRAVSPGSSADSIDDYILAALEPHGVGPAEQADPATLARRAALALTGLPPESGELRRFLEDEDEGAYERYVDRLLNDRRFGEHQARYWLDAVRYGDTHGLHLDNVRSIHPYRDWVVLALNSNLRFDQFITWQMAGDLLPDPDMEQLVATGFVRMNPTSGEGGAIEAEYQAKNNFDRTENLGSILLGMSLTCARCHTHKYDPITQEEYYRLLAFFNSTAEPAMDRNRAAYGPTVQAPRDSDAWVRYRPLIRWRDRVLVETEEELGDRSENWVQSWRDASRAKRLRKLADPNGPMSNIATHTAARELQAALDAASKEFTLTLVAKDLDQPRETRLLRRGEYNAAVGEPLSPDVPEVLNPWPDAAPRNRLGLARWLTASDNPLVTRVLVNRFWQQIFGDGLVRTPEDFGLQGEHPTHPELLDWLAVEFRESGWDLKHLLRLMVTSRTFRQHSAWRPEFEDPENRWWARGPSYRLDAEVIRDIGLWAGNLLDPHMGGPGVKPYQPQGMWKALAHPASNTKNYQRDSGPLLYRRSLYIFWKRTSPHPMMSLFDAPDRESSCVRRSRTSTALQSLALFNETQRIEMARKIAERLVREAKSPTERIDLLFGLLTCRDATTSESKACQELVGTMRKRYDASEADALALLKTGDAARDQKLSPAETAAWTQLVLTVLASDSVLHLY